MKNGCAWCPCVVPEQPWECPNREFLRNRQFRRIRLLLQLLEDPLVPNRFWHVHVLAGVRTTSKEPKEQVGPQLP